MSKSIFASKTFWINVASSIALIAQQLTGTDLVSAKTLLILTVIANVINRFFTDGSVHVV